MEQSNSELEQADRNIPTLSSTNVNSSADEAGTAQSLPGATSCQVVVSDEVDQKLINSAGTCDEAHTGMAQDTPAMLEPDTHAGNDAQLTQQPPEGLSAQPMVPKDTGDAETVQVDGDIDMESVDNGVQKLPLGVGNEGMMIIDKVGDVDGCGDDDDGFGAMHIETFDAEATLRERTMAATGTVDVDNNKKGIIADKMDGIDDVDDNDVESDEDDLDDDEDDDGDGSDSSEDLEVVKQKVRALLDDAEGDLGPIKTANETAIEDVPLPALPPALPLDTKLTLLGQVASIVDKQLVVGATETALTLDLDTPLYLAPDKPIGEIFDVFGQVGHPFYCVLARPEHTSALLGEPVYYWPEAASLVMPSELKKAKGIDASGKNDEELMAEEIEVSDDEQERSKKAERRHGSRKPNENRRSNFRQREQYKQGTGPPQSQPSMPTGQQSANPRPSWLGQWERERDMSNRQWPEAVNSMQHGPPMAFPPPQRPPFEFSNEMYNNGPFAPNLPASPHPMGSSPWDNQPNFHLNFNFGYSTSTMRGGHPPMNEGRGRPRWPR